jgi:hypothetical protein
MKKILLTFVCNKSLVWATAQNSLYFDGTNDYVETTFEGVLASDDHTFEAWIYAPSDALHPIWQF